MFSRRTKLMTLLILLFKFRHESWMNQSSWRHGGCFVFSFVAWWWMPVDSVLSHYEASSQPATFFLAANHAWFFEHYNAQMHPVSTYDESICFGYILPPYYSFPLQQKENYLPDRMNDWFADGTISTSHHLAMPCTPWTSLYYYIYTNNFAYDWWVHILQIIVLVWSDSCDLKERVSIILLIVLFD